MDLDILVKQYHRILQLNGLEYSGDGQKELNEQCAKLRKQIEEVVKKVKNVDTLVEIIEWNNEELIMPIDTMFILYQRAITLNKVDEKYYNYFANYLNMFGPDWEEEAQAIQEFIKNDQLNYAYDVALSVDYDKYN